MIVFSFTAYIIFSSCLKLKFCTSTKADMTRQVNENSAMVTAVAKSLMCADQSQPAAVLTAASQKLQGEKKNTIAKSHLSLSVFFLIMFLLFFNEACE